MKKLMFFILIPFFVFSENYLLNGGQESQVQYQLTETIEPSPGTLTIDLTIVKPQNFDSPTYRQKIEDFKIQFSVAPADIKESTDRYGNNIVKYSWKNPGKPFDARISFRALNRVVLEPVKTSVPFPVILKDPNLKIYLKSSEQVPVDDPQIKQFATELTRNSKTQFDAVQKILSHIIDKLSYVLTPPDHGAMYAFKNNKGNCQNYSHLAAAMLRANGIPTRIVNGVTLKEPFDINLGSRSMTLNMAEGRHSWIEVYFEDLGWMPFDPQQTELFVSNRFIRIETGLDNNETINDGLIRWTRQKGSNAVISFSESIQGNFVSDRVAINAKPMSSGPRKLLLLPEVLANFVPVKTAAKPAPKTWTFDEIQKLKFDQPFVFGNLDFPENVNFAFARDLTTAKDGSQQLKKNFLVETAEYVTSQNDYAQVFELEKPIILHDISLALQKFGGSGVLQLELREDANGAPGAVAAISEKINLNSLSSIPGYRWVSFDFLSQQLVLTPDRYWITLKYNGGPIINWFYSYGKPIGPLDGTRYKPVRSDSWEKTLTYEFNYRVSGKSIK